MTMFFPRADNSGRVGEMNGYGLLCHDLVKETNPGGLLSSVILSTFFFSSSGDKRDKDIWERGSKTVTQEGNTP